MPFNADVNPAHECRGREKAEMYVDNLTIAGVLAASLYAFLPLLFGRETLRIEEGTGTGRGPRGAPVPATRETKSRADCGKPHPCNP
jgi:hypothetical protein